MSFQRGAYRLTAIIAAIFEIYPIWQIIERIGSWPQDQLILQCRTSLVNQFCGGVDIYSPQQVGTVPLLSSMFFRSIFLFFIEIIGIPIFMFIILKISLWVKDGFKTSDR